MQSLRPYWHMYHAGPSPLFLSPKSYKGRVHLIKTIKPSKEQELRLRLFQPVKGKLPLPLLDAMKVRDQAKEQYEKATITFDANWTKMEAQPQEASQVREELRKAGKVLDTAIVAIDQAAEDNEKAILALHAKECPDCPWDGETIFPKGTP